MYVSHWLILRVTRVEAVLHYTLKDHPDMLTSTAAENRLQTLGYRIAAEAYGLLIS